MKYFIIICTVIILFMIWVLIPRKKKEDDSEEDFHTVEEDSPVPHTHTDSCTKFIKKIKDKKKKDDPKPQRRLPSLPTTLRHVLKELRGVKNYFDIWIKILSLYTFLTKIFTLL